MPLFLPRCLSCSWHCAFRAELRLRFCSSPRALRAQRGLGYFIVNAWALLAYPKMFAGIIAMALLGVILYELFDVAERRLTRWRRV